MAKNITFGPHDGNFVKSTADNMKSFPDTKEKPTSKIKKVNRFSCMRVDNLQIFKNGQKSLFKYISRIGCGLTYCHNVLS